MSMRKTDYELIASAIQDVQDRPNAWAADITVDQWRYVVAMTAQSIAKVLRRDDPKFDADRFLAGCSSAPKNPDGTQIPF